jgi:hypothetical protein
MFLYVTQELQHQTKLELTHSTLFDPQEDSSAKGNAYFPSTPFYKDFL